MRSEPPPLVLVGMAAVWVVRALLRRRGGRGEAAFYEAMFMAALALGAWLAWRH